MHELKRKAQLHAVWLAICVAAIAFTGTALSTRNEEPLTRSTFAKVAERTLPAVVSVTLRETYDPKRRQEVPPRLRELWDYFEFQMPRIPQEFLEEDEQGNQWLPVAGGSGVIIRPDGYIVTNYHVIAPATEDKGIQLTVTLHTDQREFAGEEVKVIATDTLRDLAVLKIDAKDLAYLKWGDSDKLDIGDWVLAVGNPLDLEGTASEGIVSQKHRKINKAGIEDLLQITAMINPGNSGGALVNLDGELVGINVAIASNTGRWQGVGFAIPSSQAQWVTDSIIKHGKVIQGYMGVQMSDQTGGLMSRQIQKYYGLPSRAGVLIDSVTPGGPAEAAKLRKGDVIVELRDGAGKADIAKNGDLLEAVAKSKVGETVTLTYYRDGKKETARVTIAERPADKELALTPRTPQERKGQIMELGMTLEEVSTPETGLRIARIAADSPAAKAKDIELKEGDVITEVDDMAVKTADDVREALKTRGKDGLHKIRFIRGNQEATTFVEL